MEEEINTKYEEITARFFELRFPEKDIKFEKKVGYFQEWVNRFESGQPENYADDESTLVISQIKAEFK